MAAGEWLEQLVQAFVDNRVERVTRAEEHRIDMRVLLKVFLVKRELSIGGLGLS